MILELDRGHNGAADLNARPDAAFGINASGGVHAHTVLAALKEDGSLMRTLHFLAIALISLSVAGCARKVPIYDVASAPIPPQPSAAPEQDGASRANAEDSSAAHANGAPGDANSSPLSAAQVRGAILEAAKDAGWVIMEDHPCRLILKLVANNRHSASVNVDYSLTNYSITYEDSVLLLYDGSNIHRNYNVWVKSLQEQIDRRLTEWARFDRRAPGGGATQAAC